MTIDEAYTYNEFASGGFTGVFLSGFDANNHILHSALVSISTSMFGLSEFSLRLPALLGSALFLWMLPLLVERVVTGSRWMQRLVFAILVLNPLTLDLLCAARGYSLALGFMTLGLLRLLTYMETQQSRDMWQMSAALGVCCCANLSFAFVSLATTGIAVLTVARRERWNDLRHAFAPGLTIALFLLILPLSRSEKGSFYWGAKDLRTSLDTTVTPFLRHDPFLPGPFGSARTVARFERRFLPAALLLLLAAGLRWFLRGEQTQLTPIIAILGISLFGYWLAHEWLFIPYPSERTGVILAQAIFLAFGGAIAALLRYRLAALPVTAPAILILLALSIQFTTQLGEPGYLWAWHQERDNRQIADLLRSRSANTLSTFWLFQPALEFYRRAGRMPALRQPIVLHPGDTNPLTGHDAYVLIAPDPTKLERLGLAVLWRNEQTNVTVATAR